MYRFAAAEEEGGEQYDDVVFVFGIWSDYVE